MEPSPKFETARALPWNGKHELLCAGAHGPAHTFSSTTPVSHLMAVTLVRRGCHLYRSCRSKRLLFQQIVDRLPGIDEGLDDESGCRRDEQSFVCRFC